MKRPHMRSIQPNSKIDCRGLVDDLLDPVAYLPTKPSDDPAAPEVGEGLATPMPDDAGRMAIRPPRWHPDR
jgi:hypothetical protein